MCAVALGRSRSKEPRSRVSPLRLLIHHLVACWAVMRVRVHCARDVLGLGCPSGVVAHRRFGHCRGVAPRRRCSYFVMLRMCLPSQGNVELCPVVPTPPPWCAGGCRVSVLSAVVGPGCSRYVAGPITLRAPHWRAREPILCDGFSTESQPPRHRPEREPLRSYAACQILHETRDTSAMTQ